VFISNVRDCIARIAASANVYRRCRRYIPTFPIVIPTRLNAKGKQTKPLAVERIYTSFRKATPRLRIAYVKRILRQRRGFLAFFSPRVFSLNEFLQRARRCTEKLPLFRRYDRKYYLQNWGPSCRRTVSTFNFRCGGRASGRRRDEPFGSFHEQRDYGRADRK